MFYFKATTAAAVFACLVWFITLKWRRTKSSSAIATRVVVVHYCTAHYTLLYTKLKIYGVFCFLLCVRVRACVYEYGVCVCLEEKEKRRKIVSVTPKLFPTAAGGQAGS